MSLFIDIFGSFNADAVSDIREIIFKEFAKSDNYGLIFTYMWAFDCQEDWDYIEHVKNIFKPYNTEFYYVELVAPQEIRLLRNKTDNRLKNKPSKRDIKVSDEWLIHADANYRCVSNDGEIPFENYIKIDNSQLPPQTVAKMIKEHFNL